MSSFEGLAQSVSHRYNDQMKKICTSWLRHLNVNHFWYHKISYEGYFTCIDSNLDWIDYAGSEKLYLKSPYFHDLKFKYGQEPIHLIVATPDEQTDQIHRAGIFFNFNLSLTFTIQLTDGIERYGFSSPSSNGVQNSLFLNHISLFYLFMKKFREENRGMFSKAQEHQISLIDIMGSKFYTPPTLTITKVDEMKQTFLKQLGVGGSLSIGEIEVVDLLLKGCSASQIAKYVHRSKRTIEHRIEKLKEKLSCFSKSELIQKAQELKSCGYYHF